MKKRVIVNDLMQRGHALLSNSARRPEFSPRFSPALTPKEMLELGVFGGKYMTDCTREFLSDWFENAKLRGKKGQNYFSKR
jgi:hypothetical protein